MTGYGVIAIVAPALAVLLFVALWRARRDLQEVEREVRRWKRDLGHPSMTDRRRPDGDPDEMSPEVDATG